MEIGILLLVLAVIFFPWLRGLMLKQNRQALVGVESKEAEALARVREIKLFYIHLGFYVLTMLALLALLQIVDSQQIALIVAIVWTLVVALHGFIVFVINGERVKAWEQRRVKSLLKKDE